MNRKDWGLAWNQALETSGVLVGDKLDVDIEVELVKQDVEKPKKKPKRRWKQPAKRFTRPRAK